ncbi:MAG TPA: pitrilysin family protein [Candidatus Paceibacterota bacterium]|nr:pitrilysin family protein [Candidatus Paceibacterota bacterium]HRZ34671.1 pitrilysin family protein [Candidatus Paceibacterota bacterium]
MWDPYAEFESAVLWNGLTVYAAHWPGRPWEAMGFIVHSGAENDPIGLEGLSHFVEHLVSENTIVTKDEMRSFFGARGGKIGLGRTGYSNVKYSFFLPIDPATIVRAFSMFGHMLLSARLDKLIERERSVILEEFNRRYPTRDKLDLKWRERKMLYPDKWLGRFVRTLGDPDSIRRITQADLQKHYDNYYTPANISIVGVGGLQISELVELLSKSAFLVDKVGARVPLSTPTTGATLPAENRHVFETTKSMGIQVTSGAYRSVAQVPGRVNNRAIAILEEMVDKLLGEEIREKRAWTYAISGDWCNYRNFYEFSINCDAFVLSALDRIEGTIEDCISSLSDREDLLEKVKEMKTSRITMLDLTARELCDDAIADLDVYQRVITLAEYCEAVNRVTMDDIRDILRWLRPARRWTLIVRP